MSDQREKMVAGAKAMRAVDAYLTFISTEKPRGRKVDVDALQLKVRDEPNLAKKVILISKLHDALAVEDLSAREERLEIDFLEYAESFSEQHGVKYVAWREVGVTAEVLKRAGIRP